MLNQREHEVTFIGSWIDFFKNIFKFNGYTTKKGYWYIHIPLMIVSFIITFMFINKLFDFVMHFVNDEEKRRQFQLLIMSNPVGFFNENLIVSRLKLDNVAILSYQNMISFYKVIMIYSFITMILTISLHVRRFRDVGFSQKGIITILVIRFSIDFLGLPDLIKLIFFIWYSLVIPCFESKKYFSVKTDSSFRKFFYVEKDSSEE